MQDERASFDRDLARVDASLRAGDHHVAGAHLAVFDLRLSGYVREEERVVFSALERLASERRESTSKMREEHQALRRLLAALWHALDDADAARGLLLVEALRSVLVLHVAKEEVVLYPLLEHAVH